MQQSRAENRLTRFHQRYVEANATQKQGLRDRALLERERTSRRLEAQYPDGNR